MFITISIIFIFVLSIFYLTFFYNEHAECESERQALIASIEQLRKTSQRRKLKKTQKKQIKLRLKNTN